MPRVTFNALLVAAAKYGAIGVVGLYLTYKLADSFDMRLKAAEAQLVVVAQKLDAHQAAMDKDAAERRANEAITRAIMRGICFGTSGDIPRARALCDIPELAR